MAYLDPFHGKFGECRYSSLVEQYAVARDAGTAPPSLEIGPIEVFARVDIFTVNEIDTATQSFTIDYQLELSWVDPEFVAVTHSAAWQEGVAEHGFQAQMTATCWHPNLICINQRDVHRKEVWSRLDEERKLITWCYRAKASFDDNYDLHRFPFDSQRLTIRLQPSWSARHVRFAAPTTIRFPANADPRQLNSHYHRNNWMLTDWAQGHYIHMASWLTGLGHAGDTASGHLHVGNHRTAHARLDISFNVHRLSSYWVINYMSVVFFVVCLGWTVWCVPPDEASDRVVILLTVLLILTAMKFVITADLPKVPCASA